MTNGSSSSLRRVRVLCGSKRAQRRAASKSNSATSKTELQLRIDLATRLLEYVREIILKRTTPRNIATGGRKSGTVIQALRYLGQQQVDDKVIAILRRQLNAGDKAQLLKDLKYAPAWVAEILRRLADKTL